MNPKPLFLVEVISEPIALGAVPFITLTSEKEIGVPVVNPCIISVVTTISSSTIQIYSYLSKVSLSFISPNYKIYRFKALTTLLTKYTI